jgi:hypothetical protein
LSFDLLLAWWMVERAKMLATDTASYRYRTEMQAARMRGQYRERGSIKKRERRSNKKKLPLTRLD